MTYTLPDLPYDYNALAPHIAPEIMELHHDKHHATYVKAANEAIDELAEAREKGDFAKAAGTERKLAFNLGGHINHSVFWQNLTKDGGEPEGELKTAIDESFDSFDKFKAQFEGVANSIFGSGWAMLCYDAISGKLVTIQLYDQQGNCPVGLVPIVVLDMWEHAFYLQYKNVKADYVKAWWNVVNWKDAGERYAKAKQTKLV